MNNLTDTGISVLHMTDVLKVTEIRLREIAMRLILAEKAMQGRDFTDAENYIEGAKIILEGAQITVEKLNKEIELNNTTS